MSISLYHAVVPSFLQILNSVAGLLDKAEAYCAEKDLDPSELIGARLAGDMGSLAFQVQILAFQSFGAIEAVRSGESRPELRPLAQDFAGLQAEVAAAIKGLDAVGYSELDAYIGKPVIFVAGGNHLHFVAEEFLLSFAQPNFYFHATTIYDILRWKGLPLGKRDFLGKMRVVES